MILINYYNPNLTLLLMTKFSRLLIFPWCKADFGAISEMIVLINIKCFCQIYRLRSINNLFVIVSFPLEMLDLILMFDVQESLCLPVNSPAISELVPTGHLHWSCLLHLPLRIRREQVKLKKYSLRRNAMNVS